MFKAAIDKCKRTVVVFQLKSDFVEYDEVES